MLGERRLRAVAGTEAADDAIRVPANRAGSVWRDPVTWTIAALVFGAYFALSLFRLLQLNPSSWDLGIYTEYVKQLAGLHAPVVDVRGAGFDLLGDHFQVALAVFAPFFRLFPSPATLLFGQALLAAISVFPVAAAGFALTGRTTGRLIALAYGFSWGLQQMVDFDFHEIALAVPLLAFALSALVRRRPLAAVGWAVPLVFVKEDQGFTVAAIGLYLLAAGALRGDWRADRRPDRRTSWKADWKAELSAIWGGAFLVVWGLTWAVLAITVIIPHFNAGHHYYYWKDGGVVGGGQSFSLGNLAGQTASGWPTKLQTVALLLLPTAFTALGSPVALLALPGLALRFMSTNSAYWSTDWHYNATIMPVLFIAAVQALARWRASSAASAAGEMGAGEMGAGEMVAGEPAPVGPAPPRRLRGRAQSIGQPVARAAGAAHRAARDGLGRHGAPMMAAICVALAFQFPLSNLWKGSTYTLDAHVAAADAAIAVVPDGATVQTTLDLLAPLAARTDTFWIGNAGNPVTQYVVFDGTDSGYSPAVTNVPAFIRQLYPGDGYVQVFARDDVYVFRRQLSPGGATPRTPRCVGSVRFRTRLGFLEWGTRPLPFPLRRSPRRCARRA